MSKLEDVKYEGWQLKPLKLQCVCGEPLEIAKVQDGQWVLAHVDKTCSLLFHNFDANKLLNDFITWKKKQESLSSNEKAKI